MNIYYILYQLNIIDVFFEAMRILIPGIIKILFENGIIFISNIRSALMGGMFDLYYLEEGKQEYKFYIKDYLMITKDWHNYSKFDDLENDPKINNYKRIVNEYILQDYYTYNNIFASRIFIYEYWYELFRTVCLYIETMLIINQKVFYEYVDYINNLYNWFSGFQILIDKSIINSNIVENLYYNISLELLMDVQSEPSKSLLLFLQNFKENINGFNDDIIKDLLKNIRFIPKVYKIYNLFNIYEGKEKIPYMMFDDMKMPLMYKYYTTENTKGFNKEMYINLIKNFLVFKKNPYKVQLELLHLYKNYSRSTPFTYGIDYDINIWKSSKYNMNTTVNYNNNNNNFYKNINNLHVINREQSYYNNMELWSPKIDKVIIDKDRLDKFIMYNEKYKNTNISNILIPQAKATKYNLTDNTVHLDYHTFKRKTMPWFRYGGKYYLQKCGWNLRNSKTPRYEFWSNIYLNFKNAIEINNLKFKENNSAPYIAINNKFNKYFVIKDAFINDEMQGYKRFNLQEIKDTLIRPFFNDFRQFDLSHGYRRFEIGTDAQLKIIKEYYNDFLNKDKEYRMWIDDHYYGFKSISVPIEVKKTGVIENMKLYPAKIITPKTDIYFKTEPDDYSNLINKTFYNESANFLERKNYYMYQKDILKNPDAVKVLGGYSYWWGWHQDAVFLHGRLGPGGTPLWHEYIKWRLNPKFKGIIALYQGRFKKKMIYGVDLTATYGVKRSYFKYAAPWSIKIKTERLRYLMHGAKVWDMEKAFFKQFLLSDDMWVKMDHRMASRKDRIYNHLRLRDYVGIGEDIANKPIGFYKFFINAPKLEHYKFWKLNWARWFFIQNYLGEQFMNDQIFYEADYDLLIQRVFNNLSKISHGSLDYSKKAMKGIRGFIIKEYFRNFWLDKYKIVSLRYLRTSNVTWETFNTNIENITENITEPFTLSYINKNYYGRHMIPEIEGFLMKDEKLTSNIKLPKNTNLLLKKAYIESLIYVYQREEEPMINYIKYKRIYNEIIVSFFQDIINIIYSSILDLKDAYEYVFNEIFRRISFKVSGHYIDLKKKVSVIETFENILKLCYKYIWDIWYVILILFIILIYCVTSSLLVLIIKSSLPKNLVYGIKVRDKIKFLKGLGNLLEPINLNLWPVKNYFDTEHRYIYRWDKKLDKYIFEHAAKYENQKSRQRYTVWKKVKGYNKFEDKKINDVRTNYVILYKTFLFEKNLAEKWENNTKIRVNIIEYGRRFANKLKGPQRAKYQWWTYILVFVKVWYLFWKDRRYNHNRKIVWADNSLEKESKVWYYMKVPKLFFDLFFYIKFILQSLRVFELSYWTTKWRQYMLYGLHFNMNYKDLRTTLEREWSLDWYKDNLDFGAGVLYKEYAKVVETFNSLKKFNVKPHYGLNKKMRNKILSDIIKETIENEKLQKIIEFKKYMKDIKNERYLNSYDIKLDELKWKIVLLETTEISPKITVEQKLRHKYINEVFLIKKQLLEEEHKIVKLNLTKRVAHDLDDEKKTVQVLTTEDWKKAQIKYKKKLWEIEYEKKLRDSNFKNHIVDKALDLKEKSFYESIKEYNKELSDQWLDIEQLEKARKAELDKYEVVSTILYSELEKYYIFFRWFTTMGARLNYLLSLIITVFAIWTEHIQKVRKNEYSTTSLIKIIITDASKFIYKIYWEYIIIFKKQKTFFKLGDNIVDILKFSLILTPLLFVISNLYLILFIYIYIINIINIEKKKEINNKIKDLITKLINNNIIKYIIIYIKNIIKILNILFRDIETGNTIFDELYKKFYKLCGWIQRNNFFIKGAFDLGYKDGRNINKGIKSVLKLFKLKYYAYIEKKKMNEHIKKKYIIEIILKKK
jgi:hypothetical protein